MRKMIMILAVASVLTACQESLEKRAAREARELTETKCPMPVGDNMYLDSIAFDIPSLTQTQFFHVYGELDNDSLFEMVDTHGLLLSELQNTPSYRPLMEKGVNFRYIYRSTLDPEVVLLDLTLTPEDYDR